MKLTRKHESAGRRDTPLASTPSVFRGAESFPRSVLDFYERFPCGGDAQSHDSRWTRLLWLEQEFGPASHVSERVLEIGCGIGVDMERFVSYGARVVGVDFASKPLQYASRRLRQLNPSGDWNLVRADARILPFKPSSFDHIFSDGVLHHIAEYELALKEANRCLRGGGSGTILVYHTRSVMTALSVLWRAVFSNRVFRGIRQRLVAKAGSPATQAGMAELLDHPLIQYFSRNLLARKIQDAGFAVSRLETHDWAFPLIRKGRSEKSDILDRHFGRFLVAQIRKLPQ